MTNIGTKSIIMFLSRLNDNALPRNYHDVDHGMVQDNSNNK